MTSFAKRRREGKYGSTERKWSILQRWLHPLSVVVRRIRPFPSFSRPPFLVASSHCDFDSLCTRISTFLARFLALPPFPPRSTRLSRSFLLRFSYLSLVCSRRSCRCQQLHRRSKFPRLPISHTMYLHRKIAEQIREERSFNKFEHATEGETFRFI